MQLIPLTQGKFSMVDDEDYEDVSKSKWFAVFDGYNWYAARKRNNKQERLHNYLMRPPVGVKIDHRDRAGLNNQRRNLRIATHEQNLQNQGLSQRNKSNFKGVSWRKKNKKWIAQARNKKKVAYLGLFDTAKEAAIVYDAFVVTNYGEFAVTNKMLGLLD